MYHAVDDPDPADLMSLRVPRQRFLEQMTLLRDEGYVVVPLGAIVDGRQRDDRTRVAITFDDGYRSDEWAATTLREFGFPATFFVVPRFLDGGYSPTAYWEAWEHLCWDDAARLVMDGFDIGAHSSTHVDLRTCAGARLDAEVSGARTVLEDRLGGKVVHFSYPHGRHDRHVRRAVERAGYELACTSRYGLNRTAGPSFAVHRTEVTGADNLDAFRLKLRGKYDWLGYWQDLRLLA